VNNFKIMKILIVPLYFVSAVSGSLVAQEHESKDSLAKYGEWMVNEGKTIKEKATNRLVRKSEEPEFVRKELIDLYINTRVQIEYLNQAYVYQATHSEVAVFIKWSESNRKEVAELEDRAIRLLDILSRMPAPKVK